MVRKVGPSGRFGARYGMKLREKIDEIEIIQRKFHKCPSCGFKKLKRISTGIWYCKKCNKKIASSAYLPPGVKIE
ncbi:MAG: 50S ribosomal protein L37ae [Candidatus Aenigmatarchaeota archaeon]